MSYSGCDDCYAYPCVCDNVELSVIDFRCDCGRINHAEYESWTCGDSLDFRCDCGSYYKKAIRIRDDQIISRGHKTVSWTELKELTQ